MTAFSFRLEKILRWRQAKMELEQFALHRLAAECTRWDVRLAEIEKARSQAEQLVLSGPVEGSDLAALARYQQHLHDEKLAAVAHRRNCEQRMEQQRALLLAARREFRLLEKLRQVRRAEWESAVNREFEALAAETYLARWAPRQHQEPQP
jgi:flagellar export protein FliJ